MSKYRQIKKQDGENTNTDDFFDKMSNEVRELFKRALFENLDMEIRKIEEQSKDLKMPQTSRRHKIQMNRLFRERVGGTYLPFPEEDNFYERMRSNFIIKRNEHFARKKTK